MTDRTVTLTRRYAAAPDAVWAAWTTESILRTWYSPMPEWIVGNATVDARVGGGYREGTYTIVEPITRLGWDSRLTGDGDSEASRIDLTFTPDGDGTILGVVESGLSEESVADHEMGWTGTLDRLEELLAG